MPSVESRQAHDSRLGFGFEASNMPAMQSGCPPAAPITPPQDPERVQRGELPAPKALEQQFDGLTVCEDTSPRSPLGTSHSSNPGLLQRGPGAALAPSSAGSDDGTSGSEGGGGGSSAAAAEEERPQWRQADHDREEPILRSNSERFCLLPVK
jgi:hypothetical protein